MDGRSALSAREVEGHESQSRTSWVAVTATVLPRNSNLGGLPTVLTAFINGGRVFEMRSIKASSGSLGNQFNREESASGDDP
jgi:hypothetical protein